MSLFFAPSLYSTKPSPPVEIPDPAAIENVTKIVPEFSHDHSEPCRMGWENRNSLPRQKAGSCRI
ncbi:hypothetical protein ACTXT7_012334 [Hymenolepis weldensis]